MALPRGVGVNTDLHTDKTLDDRGGRSEVRALWAWGFAGFGPWVPVYVVRSSGCALQARKRHLSTLIHESIPAVWEQLLFVSLLLRVCSLESKSFS